MKRKGKALKSTFKKIAVSTICTMCIIIPVSDTLSSLGIQRTTVFASSENSSIKETSHTIISQGVVRKDYTFTTTRKNKTVNTAFHVMEIDLSNQYLSLQALSADNNQTVGKRVNVRTMATQSGAIAAVNGDVFGMTNEGAPLGTHINQNGLQVSPSLLKGMYAFGVTKDKKPVIDSYVFEGVVTTQSGDSFNLAGINKSTYGSDVTGEPYSHVNTLFIYTSAWGGQQRPINSATTPTEVLVVDNKVKEVTDGAISSSIPANGYILRGHGKAAEFLKKLSVGEAVNASYHLISQTSKQQIDPNSFSMMVSGHTLLVDQGQAVSFTRDITGVSGSSYTSRTAIGHSSDKSKVYFVTAEKSGSNTGVSLAEMQSILKRLGVYKAVNLDGGGSTTMIERKLGSHDLILSHSTQESSLRAVTNGIGVFTSAPVGSLAGIIVEGAELLFVGQQTSYTNRAYDNFYNPLSGVTDVVYSDEKGLGSFEGATFKAIKSGQTTVVAKKGQVTGKKSIRIVGANDIAGLVSQSGTGLLSNGYELNTTLVATLTSGEKYKIDGKHLTWKFIGFNGEYKDGKVVVTSVNSSAQYGYAIASYDGFTTMIPFTKAETESTVENFNNVGYQITNTVIPVDQTTGAVKLVSGMNGNDNDKALQLSYDFTNGSGTQASYAVFNGTGISLASSVKSLKADVWGDNGNHWLRAELVDSTGTLHYVDLAKKVNWSGWKTIEVPFDIDDTQLKLRRIYIITLDGNQQGLAKSGQIMIDNIKQTSVGSFVKSEDKVISLTINKKEANVNSNVVSLDVAPLVKNNSTFLPFRFVSEQLGAQVEYDSQDKSVAVYYQDKYIKLFINKKDYILNGERKQASVAPYITNNRTLVPVRLISESIGFTVDYDDLTKQITIR